MRITLCFLLLLPLASVAEILTIDFVKVLNGNEAEAVYYYEENWRQYRAKALEKGYISSYQLLVKTSADGDADILLITGYADEAMYAAREENFAVVMQDPDGNGLQLLNEKSPGEFREVFDEGLYVSD